MERVSEGERLARGRRLAVRIEGGELQVRAGDSEGLHEGRVPRRGVTVAGAGARSKGSKELDGRSEHGIKRIGVSNVHARGVVVELAWEDWCADNCGMQSINIR